jgi:plastocyanin
MRAQTFLGLLLASAVVVSLATPVASHEAPAARSFETRLLHDHNDDAPLESAGKHAFDTIALDARTAWLDDRNESALVLRFILNGGCNAQLATAVPCPTMRLVPEFSANGSMHTFEIRAPQDRAVWEGDAARFVGPEALNDGTRFALEAWIPFSSFGGSPGMTLADFFVTGYSDTEEADSMPEGAVAGAPDPLGAAFNIGTYTLTGPDFYVRALSDLTTSTLKNGQSATAQLTVTNLLPLEQTVTLSARAPAGLQVAFDGQANASVALAANFTKTVPVTITAQGATSGSVNLVATTPLGGIATAAIQVKAATEAPVNETSLKSPPLAKGQTWSHTFRTAGVFKYHDHHSGALGSVELAARGTALPVNHTIAFDGRFTPDKLKAHVGDTVTWSNSADMLMVMGGVEAGDHDHADHDHDSPGAGLLLVLAGLVGAVITWRRR